MNRAKQVLVRSWLKKAQRDLIAAQKLAVDLPDIAIYHCQQAAEKALKGFLIWHDSDPGDTHNINTLVREASAFQPEFTTSLKEAAYLSQYNQTYRYPREATEDFNPSPGELKKAFRLAKQVYDTVIASMPGEIVS
ncbi:MAG: HEPN domain-containing protein [Chroococcidiopsis sp.]